MNQEEKKLLILLNLNGFDNDLTVRDLSSRIDTSRESIHHCLIDLMKEGKVCRLRKRNNQRKFYYRLTKEGEN